MDCLFHENSSITSVHCELIYNAFNKAFNFDSKSVMDYLNRNSDEEVNNEDEENTLYSNVAKLFEILLSFFPKINNKLIGRTYPILFVRLYYFFIKTQ